MVNVIFKVKTIDKDTRIEYGVSTDPVEVSDAFAKRLKENDPTGERYEFESSDDGLDELRAKYEELTGKKPGRLGAVKIQEAIDNHVPELTHEQIEAARIAKEEADKKAAEETESERLANESK